MLYYKWLNVNRMSMHGGIGQWPEPGVWWRALMSHEPIIPCRRGLHICEKRDLPFWIGKTLWLVEYEGTLIRHDNKSVVRSARLVKQLKWGHAEQMEFACRAAERVLPIFEKRFPSDTRPRNAILAARTNTAYAATAAAANAADAASNTAYDATHAATAAAANAVDAAAYAANAAAYAADAAAANAADAAAYAADAAAYFAHAAANAAYAATYDVHAAAERMRQADDIVELAGG